MANRGGELSVALFVVVSVSVGLVLVIALSGYMPSHRRAKITYCQGAFRSLQVDVDEFRTEFEGSLPKSWADLVDLHSGEQPQYFMDPFQGFRSRFKARFEEDRILFWSVGPDGLDGLSIGNDQIERDDEFVLTLTGSGEELEVEIEGF